MPNLAHYKKSLAKLSNSDLQAEFKAQVVVSGEALHRSCLCLVEMQNRGQPIERCLVGLWKFYREIAGGTISPDVAIAFVDRLYALDRFKSLPAETQTEYASGKKVKLVVATCTGQFITQEKEVGELTKREFEQIFLDDGSERSIAAQKRFCSNRGIDRRAGTDTSVVRADPDKEELIIGPYRVKIAELGGPLKQCGFSLTRIK